MTITARKAATHSKKKSPIGEDSCHKKHKQSTVVIGIKCFAGSQQ